MDNYGASAEKLLRILFEDPRSRGGAEDEVANKRRRSEEDGREEETAASPTSPTSNNTWRRRKGTLSKVIRVPLSDQWALPRRKQQAPISHSFNIDRPN